VANCRGSAIRFLFVTVRRPCYRRKMALGWQSRPVPMHRWGQTSAARIVVTEALGIGVVAGPSTGIGVATLGISPIVMMPAMNNVTQASPCFIPAARQSGARQPMRPNRTIGRDRSMDLTQIIGFAAGFGTTFAALPDLIAILKRRSRVGIRDIH
jgi:hypothetical protein